MTDRDTNQDSHPPAGEKIGRVVAVSGARATVLLDAAASQMAADSPHVIQIGSLVKMPTADTMVFGMVGRLTITNPTWDEGDSETRVVEVELVGEGVKEPGAGPMVFRRGVSYSPALGDGVYIVSSGDLAQVYARPAVESVEIGTIYQDRSLPAYVAVDDLLGKHFAILGTTGCGKSCAVATILRAIIDKHGEGHVLLLDLHSEYGDAFEDCAQILSQDNLKLPYWLLNFEELQEIVIEKGVDREIDKTILRDAVVQAKKAFHGGEEVEARYSPDSPVPYRMTELLHHIDVTLGKLEKPTDSVPYFRLRDRINTLRADRRFDFMFHERLTVDDNMVDILAQLFRIPAEGKPITILDLSEVPSDILNVVISLICRLTFDFALWSERDTPILLVCEEAHRYASQDDTTGFAPTKRALSRIVNEGRKHGVSVAIVSQRPSEMALGILSQCNTIFAMRMSNIKDQEFVRGTLSESGLGLIDSLPTLRTGEAIAVGEGVSVPVRLYFKLPPEGQRPQSGTAAFSDAWKDGKRGPDYVAEIVERWRRQRR